MTVVVPDPVPLDMPPGDPAAVDELARDVAGAATRLAGLTDELSGPAASASGWLGDDATAAAAQVVRVAEIVREAATAVQGAASRLGAHADLLLDTRRSVHGLREEQGEDHRAAWRRLQGLDDLTTAMRTDAPEALAIVEDLQASEAARRRRHALLLREVADDAAATARSLADGARPVGGTGRPGDDGRVLAYLAAELPGWGRPELSVRGRVLADALVRSQVTFEEREALAAEAAAYAGHPAFATALVRGLGEVGVGRLLELLGQDPDGPDNPMAGLLASALGAAAPGDSERDGVAAVLGATYVRVGDRYGASDTVAAGMAAVLAAGVAGPTGGPRAATVGEWARQLLVREQVQGLPAGLPPAGTPWQRQARDPAALAVGILARSGEPDVAAALLGDERVWEALLLRFWGDGGSDLAELVAEAGRDPGPAGDRAVRLGLEKIGAGLPEGDPSDRTVDRDTVAVVSPALGEAVAAHVPVVAGALTALATGPIGQGTEELVKGLGYLTVDPRAAGTVAMALWSWASAQSLDLANSSAAAPLPAVAALSAFLAVRDNGQRLTYALDGYQLQEEAQNRKLFWDWTAGLALDLTAEFARTPVGIAARVVDGYAPRLLGMDGTFDVPADRGLRFQPDDAARDALAALPPERAAQARAVRLQAEASFRRAAAALGLPEPPVSPEWHWMDPLRDIATDGLGDLVTDGLKGVAERDGRAAKLLPGRR